MKYTDLIPNVWYIGNSNNDKYILKFKCIDNKRVKIIDTHCISDGSIYSDACFSTELEIERLATNSEIFKYYPNEHLIQEDYEIY